MKQNNQQQPTPETDTEVERIKSDQRIFVCEELDVLADFARNLERQRDEAREQLEAMREAIKEAHGAMAEMLTAFDSETARQYYTATSSGGWTMLEIGACSSGRAALAKLKPFLKS